MIGSADSSSTRPKASTRRMRMDPPALFMSEPSTASGGVDWPTKYNQVLAANHRLNERLIALENAHRKSLTVVKYEPTLPNNDVYTKDLLEENRELLKRFRALELRFLQMDAVKHRVDGVSPRRSVHKPKKLRKKVGLPLRHISVQTEGSMHNGEDDVPKEHSKCLPKFEDSVDPTSSAREQQAASYTTPRPQSSNSHDDEVRTLVTLLKRRLSALELDLGRLQQENELLRADKECCDCNDSKNEVQRQSSVEQRELEHLLNDRIRQMAVLEAKFTHLQDKAHTKSKLHKEAIEKIEELNSELFNVRQKLLQQAEWLQELDDKNLQLEILGKEVHLLRSETLKLNETIAALSSRPFDTLDAQLEKKSVAIAVLEEENRVLQSQMSRVSQDFRIVTQTNDKLRERINKLSVELETQEHEVQQWKSLREQDAIARNVAEMQLKFYLSKSGDADARNLLVTIGKALKMLRTQDLQKLS